MKRDNKTLMERKDFLGTVVFIDDQGLATRGSVLTVHLEDQSSMPSVQHASIFYSCKFVRVCENHLTFLQSVSRGRKKR